jgi:hypothetical protein
MEKLRTSKEEIEDFKKSLLWADIVDELDFWKEGFRSERDGIVEDAATNNPSTASVLLHLGDINGRVKAVDYMLGILDVFASQLDTEVKKDGRNKTNRR